MYPNVMQSRRFQAHFCLSAAVNAIDYGLCGVCILMVDKISSAPREKMMRGFGGSLGSVHRMRLYCTIMDEN